METVSRTNKLETQQKTQTQDNSLSNTNFAYEVVVIEDNQLTNTVLSRALNSAINTIHSLKNIQIKFSSFQNGQKFLTYFGEKVFDTSRLIVFSDYYLEENMNGVKILKSIKLKKADSTVIIMSDSGNSQIAVDAENSGAYCFLPKNLKTPVICSELLFQMID